MALTLEEMRAVIKRGESVMHGQGMNTRIISREEDLPTEADLAHGDREKLEGARQALVDRRARLDAEIAAVESELATLGSQQQGTDTGTAIGTGRSRRSARVADAGPEESGDDNSRSQVTATVGTADSDAAADAAKTDTSAAAGA